MARVPDQQRSTRQIDPNADYYITVNKVVHAGGAVYLRPSSARIKVTGAYLETLGDAVETYEKA